MKHFLSFPNRILFHVAFALLFPLLTTPAEAKPSQLKGPVPRSGVGLYHFACAACHGSDGRGAPADTVGFDVPLPDFTDCNFVTREAAADWIIVAQEGGPARGFSEIMPAFGDALTISQIEKILKHINTFSECDSWPRGELNLPLAFYTTKAFPEDELVLSTAIETDGLDKISNKLIYERRIGDLNQVEVALPMGWNTERTDGGHTEWTSSIGDLTLGVKRVLFHSLSSGYIVSAGGDVKLPTGDEDKGFGNGTTVFEPYLAYGQLLPYDFFLQFQGGFEIPYSDDRVQDEVFWRGLIGHTFALGRYGSSWSPMVEFLGSENLVKSDDTNWDVVPQLQVSLNRRQHVRLGIGARIPMNDTDVRTPAYLVYLMWDMFDGGFFEGW